jgi:hypothetical protein
MSGDLKENVTRRSIWLRLVFMIVLSVAFNVAEIITFAVVVFQFLASLFTGQPNDRLAHFGRNLARYFQQITVYLAFTTEEKPFPFAPWPDESHEEAPVDKDSIQPIDKSGHAGDTTENDEPGEANRTNDTEAVDNEEDADKTKD